MKKRFSILVLVLAFVTAHVKSDTPNEKMPDDDNDLYKNETLESCYAKTVSAYIQSCLIYLEDDKKEAYKTTFNQFIKNIQKKIGIF